MDSKRRNQSIFAKFCFRWRWSSPNEFITENESRSNIIDSIYNILFEAISSLQNLSVVNSVGSHWLDYWIDSLTPHHINQQLRNKIGCSDYICHGMEESVGSKFLTLYFNTSFISCFTKYTFDLHLWWNDINNISELWC